MVDRRKLAEVILKAGELEAWKCIERLAKVSPGLPQGWNKVKPTADGRSKVLLFLIAYHSFERAGRIQEMPLHPGRMPLYPKPNVGG